MAHPDDDQVIGRLAAARLRAPRTAAPADGRALCPDAETWAAYLDGGLGPDEVARLDTHLAGCASCRQLVASIAPDAAASTLLAGDGDETAPAASGGVVLPFPRRPIVAWAAMAAGLLLALTLWSVSRLERSTAETRTAQSREADLPVAAAPRPAPPAGGAPAAAASRIPPATPAPPAMPAAPPQDTGSAPAALAERQLRKERGAMAVSVPTAGRIEEREAPRRSADEAKPAAQPAATAGDWKRAEDAGSPVSAGNRVALTQSNAAANAVVRPHGPLATQQQNVQNAQRPNPTGAPAGPAPASASPEKDAAAAPAPVQAPAAPPVTPPARPAEAAAAAAAPALADTAETDAQLRRGNEQVADAMVTTGAVAGRAGRAKETARADGGRALPGNQAGGPAGFATAATGAVLAVSPTFSEPTGRLLWRIVDGRRLESSSDAGATWSARYTARRGNRLRAGTAPAIDSAWVVGDGGLVLRLTVPGGWTPAPRPVSAPLVAVSATGTEAARVTAADGRVFQTADGGNTWTPAGSGAGPP